MLNSTNIAQGNQFLFRIDMLLFGNRFSQPQAPFVQQTFGYQELWNIGEFMAVYEIQQSSSKPTDKKAVQPGVRRAENAEIVLQA